MAAILLVDDEQSFTEGLAALLRAQDHNVTTADSLGAARTILGGESVFELLLIDLMLPDGNGLELLEEIDADRVQRTVVMTGHTSIKSSISKLHGPGVGYLTKPIEMRELQRVLDRVVAATRGASEPVSQYHFGVLLGESEPMQAIYQQIEQVAPMDTTVLIMGESGTGKELIAEAIHTESHRTGPFVPVNCGAITGELVASELFGHEKGSFTGAQKRHLGVFERAQSGTLFLDEVTEMPIDQQPHLLRAIEAGIITRVGGEEPIAVSPRLIAASNRDTAQAIEEGRLREDLYFRLSVFPIELPPLRERRADIGLLAAEFLRQQNEKYSQTKRLNDELTDRLLQWSWPGNVRELKHTIHRAFISTVEPDALLALPDRFDRPFASNEGTIEAGRSVREVEKDLILATMAHFDGNRKQAAEMLGISSKTLYNRLSEYEQEDEG